MRLLLLIFIAIATQADDWQFLTIGGGYSPDGNQVSLEKNVQFYQRLLTDLRLAAAPHHLLFADGNSSGRDLHFEPPEADVPEINDLLSRVLGHSDNLGYNYRSHELRTNGDASVASIDRWFKQAPKKLADSRLLIYFTGHGGPGPKKRPGNTVMHLWQEEDLRVAEFAKRLDTLPVSAEVVLVMVQCFSGGFANILFKDGNPKKGLAPQPRAGFFATVQDHYAAGCTPDIDEANYQDYSTSFFAALWGKDRIGNPVAKPDYNDDGVVSFAEAHAYTVIHSINVDAPVKTSGVFLRQYSSLDGASFSKKELFAAADSAEHAILTAVGKRLQHDKAPLAGTARSRANALYNERDALEGKIEKLLDQQETLLESVAADLTAQWPELKNPWHPRVRTLMEAPHRQAILDAIQTHADYAKYEKLDKKLDAIDARYTKIDQEWPDWERFARTAENVILRQRLPELANSAIQARFAQLIKLEEGTLAAPVK
jgi:hypothetical protein